MIRENINKYNSWIKETIRNNIEEMKYHEKLMFLDDIQSKVLLTDKTPKPEVAFNNMLLSHGILTNFSEQYFDEVNYGKDEYFKMISNFRKVLEGRNNSLISCSHESQNLGPVGFYLKGNNIIVGKEDLVTRIVNGIVFYHDTQEQFIVSKLDEYILSNEIHSEHIINNYEIKGIWFKKAFIPVYYNIYKLLKNYCEENNLIFKLLSDTKIYVSY